MSNFLPIATAIACAVLSTPAAAERGSDGALNLLYWQAPTSLNPYLSAAVKDSEAASLTLEPLARYDETGALVPFLAAAIPTMENGGISPDMTSITWTLRDGLTWSDGTPVTSADMKFTADYCMDPAGACQQAPKFADIASIDIVDDKSLRITFTGPKPFPYGAFVGVESPILQQAQFADCTGANAANCTQANLNPVGTGPYVVTEMRSGDVVTYDMNPHYRDAAKPAFANVTIKGGGDATSAARTVLETGEFDYAWNLQVDPEILKSMAQAGKGEIITSRGTAVERLMVNLTNPSADMGDKRSMIAGGAHPAFSDTRVTQALSLAIDRAIIAELGYGDAGEATCNLVAAPAIYASDATAGCMTQDIAKANMLLDAAGWTDSDGDGIRDKDGAPLALLFQTSVNPVRQTTQDLIKAWWSEIGVETELRAIDPSVFFGADQSSPDTFRKFFADIQMYTNFFPGTDPESYLNNWTCGEIPTPDTGWTGANIPRYCDPAYDALTDALAQTADLDRRIALVKEMNDMLINAGAIIPLVHRGDVSAIATTLKGVRMNAWDSELWNIADWTRAK